MVSLAVLVADLPPPRSRLHRPTTRQQGNRDADERPLRSILSRRLSKGRIQSDSQGWIALASPRKFVILNEHLDRSTFPLLVHFFCSGGSSGPGRSSYAARRKALTAL